MSSVFKTNYPYALIHSKSIKSSAFSLKKIDTSKSAECLFYTNVCIKSLLKFLLNETQFILKNTGHESIYIN